MPAGAAIISTGAVAKVLVAYTAVSTLQLKVKSADEALELLVILSCTTKLCVARPCQGFCWQQHGPVARCDARVLLQAALLPCLRHAPEREAGRSPPCDLQQSSMAARPGVSARGACMCDGRAECTRMPFGVPMRMLYMQSGPCRGVTVPAPCAACATPIQLQDVLHKACAVGQGSWGRRVKACGLRANGADVADEYDYSDSDSDDEDQQLAPEDRLLPPACCYALVADAVACLPLLERLFLDVLQAAWPHSDSDRPYSRHLQPLQGLLHLSDLEVVYRSSTDAELQVGAMHCVPIVPTGCHRLARAQAPMPRANA